MFEWDDVKRQRVLAERRLDFADASALFEFVTFTLADDRRDYGEDRWLTYGRLRGDIVQLVWTWRGERRRVISMRKCHGREAERAAINLDRSG